jgi:ABC-2 type transport system permease protein
VAVEDMEPKRDAPRRPDPQVREEGFSGLRNRGALRSTLLSLGAVLALVLLVMVNYLGAKYYARADWTAGELYTLSEKTRTFLDESLDRPVEVSVFLVPDAGAFDALIEPVRELLQRYEAASSHIDVHFVDPVKNPAEARQLAERFDLQGESVVVFATQDDQRIVPVSSLAELDFSGVQFGGMPDVRSFKGEQEFTGALLGLVEGDRPRVLFTIGHGERTLDDQGPGGLALARQVLERDNVEIDEWASLGASSVPADADVVVIAGPQANFVQPEVELLRRFVDRGGSVLVLLDPTQRSDGTRVPVGIEDWLEELGVEVGWDVVLDPRNPLPFFGAETLFVTGYEETPVTRALERADLPVLVQLARSVKAGGGGATELLRTSDEGWGETSVAGLFAGVVERDGADVPGPVPLGVAVETAGGDDTSGDAAEEEDLAAIEEATDLDEPPAVAGGGDEGPAGRGARLVVLGDSDFAANQLLQSNVGNQVLLSNAVNWLVEREALLGIPVKDPEQVRLTLSTAQIRWVYILVLLLLPAAAVALGVGLFLRRRR